jgi:adenylate cyclase
VSSRHPDFDYEAEGLLDEIDTAEDRESRRRLLDYLIDEEMVEPDEILQAHAERRLFLLPIERALSGVPEFNADQVAELSGIDRGLLLELRRSLGLAEAEGDQTSFSDSDVKTMRAVRAILDMGMPLESVREINRVLGGVLSQLAVVVERQFLISYLDPDIEEAEAAKRYAAIARATAPGFAFVLQHLFNLHLRDQLRADVLGSEDTIDLLSGKRELAVCFADLIGFTSLGEQIAAEELGAIAERLATIAAELVEPPVRLVKSIGDAVMLVSPEPAELMDTAIALMAAVDREGEDFPRLSAGIAFGEAVDRSGDIYGPPVNLASRLCDMARADSILTTDSVHEMFVDDYDWTNIGRRRLKGLSESTSVWRLRELGSREAEVRRRRERSSEEDV